LAFINNTNLELSPDKFYKRGSQEKYISCGRIFSRFPARMIEQDWF
jgi:hypothetical protein